jgi:hypothetical protein
MLCRFWSETLELTVPLCVVEFTNILKNDVFSINMSMYTLTVINPTRLRNCKMCRVLKNLNFYLNIIFFKIKRNYCCCNSVDCSSSLSV